MKYIYAYKTSDGTRHEATINASSRESAFSELRKNGIRPIKVYAADGSKANGEFRGVRKRIVALLILIAVVGTGLLAYYFFRSQTYTPQSTTSITLVSATPLPRQEIQGDRQRIGNLSDIFPNKVDAFLARFAEPGRVCFASKEEWPTADEIAAAIKEPLKIASDELTEIIDLTRIVAGLRKELRGYVQGGGSTDSYIEELIKRQDHEVALRQKNVIKLGELLDQPKSKGVLQKAYDYWLKSNAQLDSMGIYAIPMPEALRDYQKSINLEDQ